jgi:regulator of replication initiation timing
MPVFHIIETAYPAIAVRTTRNRRSAEMLLSYFGEGFEISEDVYGEIREKTVDILAELRDTVYTDLRNCHDC